MKIKLNEPQVMDGLALLQSLKDRSAAAVFFDAQYRQGLDKLAFGNEGARQSGRAALPQMSNFQIAAMVEEIERILKSSGHLFLWLDKFALVSGLWRRWLPKVTSIGAVDMISWDKDRIGMGRRFRCQTEFMVVLQRGPLQAAGIWSDHRIGDCWREKADRKRHPHAKPVALIERVIRAVTKPGDFVVDPCAGGYSVLDACRRSKRQFIGCDLADSGDSGGNSARAVG